MAEKVISSITYRDDTYLLKNAVLMRKTFENVIATANDMDNATFYFGKIIADSWDTPLRIRYRVKAYCPANKNYNQYADVSYFIIRNTAAYCVENVIFSTSYRAAYYHNLYRATQVGSTAYGHLLGESICSSTNPLDTTLKRTFEFEILELENCTFEFFENPVLYKNAPGTGSTNYTGRSDYTFANSGLYPDSNTANDTKVRQTLSTVNEKHPILMGYSQTSDTTANVDNVSYRNNSVYVNPSTGTVGATKVNISEKVVMQYDSANECLEFVF